MCRVTLGIHYLCHSFPIKLRGISRVHTLGYVIVNAQLPGIYGSKPTESEGVIPRTRLVYVAINPWQLCINYYYYIPSDWSWLRHAPRVFHSNSHSKQRRIRGPTFNYSSGPWTTWTTVVLGYLIQLVSMHDYFWQYLIWPSESSLNDTDQKVVSTNNSIE